MSDTPPATPSPTRTKTPRAGGSALIFALCAVLLLNLPRARAQWREHSANSERGRPFWMQPVYPALVEQLDAALPNASKVILFSDRVARDHQHRVFGLQFHAVPRSVHDVTKLAAALAALRAGAPVLVDLSDEERSVRAALQLAEATGARVLHEPSHHARLLVPAEPGA